MFLKMTAFLDLALIIWYPIMLQLLDTFYTTFQKTSSVTTTLFSLQENLIMSMQIRHWPGGHEVVVVEHLNEGLDLWPFGDLLLAHGCGHLTGIAVDAGDQSVAVGAVSGAIINVLQADISRRMWHQRHETQDEKLNYHCSMYLKAKKCISVSPRISFPLMCCPPK